MNFKGKSSLYALVNSKKAFVYVSTVPVIQITEKYATKQGVDIIQEHLGKMEISLIYFPFRKPD